LKLPTLSTCRSRSMARGAAASPSRPTPLGPSWKPPRWRGSPREGAARRAGAEKSCRRARSAGKHREVKRHYILAIVCYLLIPVAVVAGAAAHQLIDPEMARFPADYPRRYQFLDRTRTGLLMASWPLACALWVACCFLVLESRQRSRRWLSLAAAGPFRFSVIAALEDRAPAPRDLYQRFITSLKTYWRWGRVRAASSWCSWW